MIKNAKGFPTGEKLEIFRTYDKEIERLSRERKTGHFSYLLSGASLSSYSCSRSRNIGRATSSHAFLAIEIYTLNPSRIKGGGGG